VLLPLTPTRRSVPGLSGRFAVNLYFPQPVESDSDSESRRSLTWGDDNSAAVGRIKSFTVYEVHYFTCRVIVWCWTMKCCR